MTILAILHQPAIMEIADKIYEWGRDIKELTFKGYCDG
jgi:hypothetical protein